MNHVIKDIIAKCDTAIKNESFDELMNYYTDDAILVVKPGMIAQGKKDIKSAFIKIAAYFKNSIKPTQGEMIILETGDTALVISQTILDAENRENSDYSMDRRATYIFRKCENIWKCAIDNSYGTDLIK